MDDFNNKRPRFVRFAEFIDRHKVGLTATVSVIATAVILDKLNRTSYDTALEFIDSKGLTTEFFEFYPSITK